MSAALAKELLARTGEHPVVSLYFDLDPSQFATAPARATQARSLLDAAHNLLEAEDSLGHDARQAVRGDLERLEEWLGSDELPVSGAAGLAVFACAEAGLFETRQLGGHVEAAVHLERFPVIEPLVAQRNAARWAVAIVSSEAAEIWFGHGATVDSREESAAYVRGHASGDDTEGHINQQDVDEHLAAVAAGLDADRRRGRFGTLMLAGPVATTSRLQGHLSHELHDALAGERLEIDPSAVTEAELAQAVATRLSEAEERVRGELLARFADGLGGGGRACGGVADTLAALAEARVETLLVGRDFHAAGTRCPRCGLLGTAEVSECPADGTATAPVADLREPMIAQAVTQDATVLVMGDPVDELPTTRPVGALLRF
jgi:peptide chain release factor subunit 1